MLNTESNRQVGTSFQFHLELMDDQRRPIKTMRLSSADFGRAVYATSFDAFRKGKIDTYVAAAQDTRITPLFIAESPDSPQTRGFQVSVILPVAIEHHCEFGVGYFASQANLVRAELVRDGTMDANQDVLYQLAAYHDDAAASRNLTLPISLEPVACHVPIRSDIPAPDGPAQPWDDSDDRDVPILIDRAVLEEVVEEAQAAPQREIGGVLLGHLVRRQQEGDVSVMVTGLAAGGNTTTACSASVTFTPETFALAREIVQLRGVGESIVGWYHSHPFRFCAECPLPTPPECIAKVLFFSQDDIHLMETTFDQPFMVGLLAAVEPRIETAIGHLPVRLFGWRDGSVRQRGFDVV